MVGEFPGLQGVMGRAYARLDGEDELVATGIYEHYLPRGAGDTIPRSPTGIAVGLADRLDLLAGFFGLGLIPTGSADPFALRRTALGVTRIVMEGALTLGLDVLLEGAFAGYGAAASDTAKESLRDFIAARLEVQLRERGQRYDVVDAVLAAGFDDLTDTLRRAEALSRALAAPAFAAVTVSFKRVANISVRPDEEPHPAASDTPMPDPDVPAELALWNAFTELRGAAEQALAARDYERFYQTVGRLKQPVDSFFDEVLVMDPDPNVRGRRLGLLRSIAALLTRPADLKRLAVG
jgi:glycyl-tRNA synthetase beta chain